MTSQDTVNFTIMAVLSVLMLGEGLVAWRRLRFAGGRAVAVALFVGAAEALCYALVFRASQGPTALRLAAAYAVSGAPLAACWFIFAMRFVGVRRLGGRWPVAVLACSSAGFVIAAALWPALVYPSSRGFTAMMVAHVDLHSEGILFAVQIAWSSALVLAGLVPLLAALRSWRLSRRQAIVAIAAVVFVFVINSILVSGYEPVHGLQVRLMVVAAGLLPLIWLLPRLRSVDLLAAWQPRILESMADAVLVADGEGHIVRANRAAQRLLTAGRPDGRPARRLDECDWLAGLDGCGCELSAATPPDFHSLGAESGCVVTMQREGRTHHLDVRQSALGDRHGRELSRVFVLRDVTEHAVAAAAARDSDRQLNVLLDRLDEANQDLRTLVEAGREFGASLKPEDVLDAVVRRMGSLTGASRCSLYRFDGETMTALLTAEGETVTDDCAEFNFAVAAHTTTRQAVQTRLPVGVADMATDPGVSDVERGNAVRLGYRASLDLPLVTGGKVVGLVSLVDAQPREFDHVELLRGLAPIAAQALVNSQVYAEQRQTARRLSLVSAAGKLFSSSLAIDDLLVTICRSLSDMSGAPICNAYVVEDGVLRSRASLYDGEVDREWMAQQWRLEEWPTTKLALDTGKPVAVRGLSDWRLSEAQRTAMEERGERSLLAVPLIVGGEAFGSIELVDRRERVYGTEELRTVEAVCGAAALAIRNADTFGREQDHAARLASLLDASRAMTSTISLDEVLAIVAESSCRAVGAQRCAIWENHEDETVLSERSYFSSRQTDYTPTGRIELDKNPLLRAVLDEGVVVQETISSATLHPKVRAMMDERHEKSHLLAPLVFDGRAIGLMTLVETENERHYRPEEIVLVQALADQAAVAVQNAHHYEQLERTSARLESQIELGRVVLELSGDLIAVHDLQGVFSRIATLMRRVVNFDVLEVRLVDRDARELYCGYASDADADEILNWRYSLDRGVDGWVVRHNEAQLVNDMVADPRSTLLEGTEEEQQASIVVPLNAGGAVIGVLVLDRLNGWTFGDHELESALLFANLAAVAIRNARQYEDVKRVHTSNLRTLCVALNAKDHYTLGHTTRVASYLMLLCRELGWPDETIQTIGEAAYLHDIGKIAISDRILTKPGRLNDREWQLMRQHPELSAEIVRPLYGDDVVAGVRHHHERYDGRGYPDGLAGQDIPLIARAMCVVDSYDAMSFERPYHRGLSYTQCRAEIERNKGAQFDPVMADALLRVLESLATTRARALAVAERTAAQIDGDEHAALVATGAVDTDAYGRLTAQLRAARDAEPGVRFVETVAMRDGHAIFVCDAEEAAAQRSRLGEDVAGYEEIAHTLAGERPDICVVAADEFGVWISGMAPIRRRDGEIVGVVVVDFPANKVADEGGLYAGSSSALTGLLHGAAERAARTELDAVTDTLTGLANHRHFHERLAGEFVRAQESGHEFSLLLCDIDRFAAFNGRLGHTQGDEALRAVGQLLEGSVRGVDLCARIGGDEFAVVLVDTGAERALQIAETLRATVAAAGLGDPAAPLTIGVGLATFPWDAVDKDALLDRTRWAVSLAKHRGGNFVVQFADRPEMRFETGRDQAVGYLSLMAELADAKMLYGEKHSGAVARLATALAVDLGLDEVQATDAGTAARLCDIGHIGVPDEVLSKPGRLSDEERQLISEHPRAGERLLRRMEGLEAVADGVGSHHERFDGTGYPARLKGEAIPVIARIVAVASTFQALVNRRPYRLERSHEDALAEMRRCAGSQFDPVVVAALERVLSHAEGVSWVSPVAGLGAATSDAALPDATVLDAVALDAAVPVAAVLAAATSDAALPAVASPAIPELLTEGS